MLQAHWQMMGALEAADGMLLFGISTAFIFTAMQLYLQHLVLLERPGESSKPNKLRPISPPARQLPPFRTARTLRPSRSSSLKPL